MPILCDGDTYGTMDAMRIYLDLMASGMINAQNKCNDQAFHIHIVYMGILKAALDKIGASLVVQGYRDTLVGVIGTAPYVRYNHWGEILNDEGNVMTVVHQSKHHERVTDIIDGKFAWHGPLAVGLSAKPVYTVNETYRSMHPDEFPHVIVTNVPLGACEAEALCSCKFRDCQCHNHLSDTGKPKRT